MKRLYPIALMLLAALVLTMTGCGSKPKKSYFDWLADADTKMQSRNFVGALEDYDEALKVRQDDPMVWFYRGNAQFKLGKQQDALRSYMNAVKLNPNLAEAHYNAGIVLTNLGRWDEAIEAFQRTVAIDPKHAKAWYNLGMVFKRGGMTKEADNAFKKATALDPGIVPPK